MKKRAPPAGGASFRVGLISDTHGLLRPEAVDFLSGCCRIIHGGDVGGPELLERLAALAPLVTVRGNNDSGPWAERLHATETLQVAAVRLMVIHNLGELAVDPGALGIGVVISGHSHKPSIQERDGVLFVNPGSAGPRRFKLPISVGELVIQGASARARIVDL